MPVLLSIELGTQPLRPAAAWGGMPCTLACAGGMPCLLCASMGRRLRWLPVWEPFKMEMPSPPPSIAMYLICLCSAPPPLPSLSTDRPPSTALHRPSLWPLCPWLCAAAAGAVPLPLPSECLRARTVTIACLKPHGKEWALTSGPAAPAACTGQVPVQHATPRRVLKINESNQEPVKPEEKVKKCGKGCWWVRRQGCQFVWVGRQATHRMHQPCV